MHITPLDRRLLLLLDRNPTAPATELATELGVGERTVTRRYAQLRDAGLVRILGRTLPSFDNQVAWLVRAEINPLNAHAFARKLAELPRSRWVRVSNDGTEINCGFVTSEKDNELQLLLRSTSVHRVRTHELLRVFTHNNQGATASAGRALDAIDQEILAALGRDGRADSTRIARQTGVNSSTISRRKQRLIKDGILYFEAEIEPEALALAGDALLWLRVQPGHLIELANHLRSLPECRFVAACTGVHNMVVNVRTVEVADIIDFVDVQLANRGVMEYEIFRVGATYKRAGR
ncbi:Lrp/AsnC family transcriptional regulator [Corynebacterium epidermidicanis]|uniref:Transcriptional regulator n=1 Tax=Corynebacterium epidermidicanis TaxID=1050174 RepID=A0A0G3GKZ5_9CORY|nr:Lrp/AsnC family transcriptional regulator [Corynebacterium epidermidicanis]AKK01916.1 transcriptional regulator [Corynebacterium epidermidicanis]